MSTTYKLTPDTGQVSGTNSNMPLYVKPSVLECGSLTLAEAQSLRFFSDASLTTELAREVVSADEIHVKVPSVSSSTEIWMNYDGIRSDYAVTATYGSNAVWSDYVSVLHMDESSGNAVDSTGNGDWTDTNTVGSGTGQIEGGRDFVRANGEHFVTTRTGITGGMSELTVQFWVNPDTFADPMFIWSFERQSNPNDAYNNWALLNTNGTIQFGLENNSGSRSIMNSSTGLSTATWQMVHTCWDGTTLRAFLNGSADGTTAHSATTYSDASVQKFWGGNDAQSTRYLDGLLDECRVRQSYVGADWITTEYNNQNDNAAFWVATAVGGGGVVAPQFLGFAGL